MKTSFHRDQTKARAAAGTITVVMLLAGAGCAHVPVWDQEILSKPELWDVGIDAETLAASDVRLDSVKADANWKHRGGETTLTADWTRHELEYAPAPADIITLPARRNELRRSAQFDSRWDAAPGHTWLTRATVYRGFSEYRVIWIDEHDRQLFEGTPNFRPADPHGWNALVGSRWAWEPGSR